MGQSTKDDRSRNVEQSRHPKVDFKTVRSFEKLEWELAKLGVEIKPEYKLEPPLGTFRPTTRTSNF